MGFFKDTSGGDVVLGVNQSVVFGPGLNMSITIGCTALKFCENLYGLCRVNPDDMGDFGTFPPVQP